LHLGTRFAEQQQQFAASGKPTRVTLAFHVTNSANRSKICEFGLVSFSKPWGNSVFDTFGKGVYTTGSPFHAVGEVGIIVATLRGTVARVGMGELDDNDAIDTGVGNLKLRDWKNCDLLPRDQDETVLKSVSQCLPLALYDGSPIRNGHAENGVSACLWRCVALRELVDEFFNNGTAASTKHPGASLHHGTTVTQTVASSMEEDLTCMNSPPSKRVVPSSAKTPTFEHDSDLRRSSHSVGLRATRTANISNAVVETLHYQASIATGSTCPSGAMTVNREHRGRSSYWYAIRWSFNNHLLVQAHIPDTFRGYQLMMRLKWAWMSGIMFSADTNGIVLNFKSVEEFMDAAFLSICDAELDEHGVPPASSL
jgi:hypothetical protein